MRRTYTEEREWGRYGQDERERHRVMFQNSNCLPHYTHDSHGYSYSYLCKEEGPGTLISFLSSPSSLTLPPLSLSSLQMFLYASAIFKRFLHVCTATCLYCHFQNIDPWGPGPMSHWWCLRCGLPPKETSQVCHCLRQHECLLMECKAGKMLLCNGY